jgi:ribonuclease P protein component
MLPKPYRFPLRQQPQFFQHARRLYLPDLVVLVGVNALPNQGPTLKSTTWQAAVRVGKTVSKLAVTRNSVKRKLHEALASYRGHQLSRQRELQPDTLLILPKKSAIERSMVEFQHQLLRVFAPK